MQVGDAYLIVYSITDRTSFEKASELRIQLRRARQTEDIPIILVGNKSDLVRCREVSVSGKRSGANGIETISGSPAFSFKQVFFTSSFMKLDSLKCYMEFYIYSENPTFLLGHLCAGCCSLIHLVYLQDSNLPTHKGFPGILLRKRSCSGLYWQFPTFFPASFYSLGRSQEFREVEVASSSKKDGNSDLRELW